MSSKSFLLSVLFCVIGVALCQSYRQYSGQQHPKAFVENVNTADVQPAASERFLDLGSLFNKYPNNYYQNQRPYNNYNGNGYYPQTGVSSSGYYPQSGGGYYPGSNTGGGYYPGSNTGYGTNILGSGSFGGGYGGYGGYGGNGGLPSYIGYNNQNYNGKRNLGFGYYHGTNSYGLIPSREMGYTPGTGYRGYN